jgi:hypothetical protein
VRQDEVAWQRDGWGAEPDGHADGADVLCDNPTTGQTGTWLLQPVGDAPS